MEGYVIVTYLLSPIHSVPGGHLAMIFHLLLGGVPEVIVGVSLLQLIPAGSVQR